MLNIFISYSHKDGYWFEKVLSHLKVLEQDKEIAIWNDQNIEIGTDWFPEIERHLNNADVAVLLISVNYLTSNFILKNEVPSILRRREKEGLKVIPFIIKPCPWKTVKWLSSILAFPKDGKALIDGTELDIENNLSQFAEKLHALAPKQTSTVKIFQLPVSKPHKVDTKAKRTTKKENKNPATAPLTKGITLTAQGHKNIQVAGDFYSIQNITSTIRILPPPETIGANLFLKQRIAELFNKIGDERKKRFGEKAYSIMYNKFKYDFGIKNQPWTIIWTWPEACAISIIEYLDDKYSNTIQGRIENVSTKSNYIPARPYLYKKESELLEQIGLTINHPEIDGMLNKYFGVTSHTKLTRLQHWQFVKYLERYVKDIIGE